VEPRDRVVGQLEHRETDFVPYVIPIGEQVGERLDRHYGGRQWRQAKCDHIAAVDVAKLFDFENPRDGLARDAFGSLWRTDREPAHLVEPALPEPDLSDYEFPDPDDVFRDNWLEEGRAECERLASEGRFAIAVLGYCLFERSWTLRGYENALMDMVARPDFYGELLERIMEFNLQVLSRYLQLPIDGIQTGDDWGTQRGLVMGKRRWMELFLPLYAQIWGRVKEAGLYAMHHSCGNISQIVGEAAGVGLDCFESVQPEAMEPYGLKRRFGDRIAFWGGVGTQHLLPHGSPEAIRSEVARLCREMSRGGGYILAPAKPVMPDVPTENAAAFLEAVLEQAGCKL
jgi:uroporphyrinogen decarboxylase